MYIFRSALGSDLSSIHNLQNSSLREKILIDPLPPEHRFIAAALDSVKQNRQEFYVLEQNGTVCGFASFEKDKDLWYPTVWGKWLATLVVAACETAFTHGNASRLQWYVRQNNRRMLRLCERFGFRKTDEKSFCHVTEALSFIAVGKANLYELTQDEWKNKSSFMKNFALKYSTQIN